MAKHTKHKSHDASHPAHQPGESHAEHQDSTTEHHAHHKNAKEESVSSSQIIATVLITLVSVAVLFAVGYFIFMPKNANGANLPGGNGDKIIIYEYSDFECPFCARAVPTVNQLKAEYGNRVEIVFKHFPLGMHPNAPKAAEASECARDQGKFWEYHDVLFENQNKLTVSDLKAHAKTLSLDSAKFDQCLDSNQKKALVDKDLADGQAAGVTGTPTFIIGTQKIVGAQPLSEFKKAIEAASGVVVESNDPVFGVTVIEDSSCATCQTDQVVSAITDQLFPTAKVTKVQKEDAAALIEKYQLTALPAYLFDEAVASAGSYAQVAQAFTKVADKYIIVPGAAGPVKLLEPIAVQGRPTIGNGPILMVEFAEFECPFCKKYYDESFAQIKKNYIDTNKVTYVFMHFPLGFHANAKPAAQASECAHEQGKFWDYHSLLFKNQNALDLTSLKLYATQIQGLDTAKFNACLDSNKYEAQVSADEKLGASLGVSGTPTFFIDGVQYVGAVPYAQLQEALDAAIG